MRAPRLSLLLILLNTAVLVVAIGVVTASATRRLGKIARDEALSTAAVAASSSVESVQRIIDACEVSRPDRIRDRAILLLLARLGLRAGDVVGLELRHIDWAAARLRVVGKGRREARLPLPQEVGDARLAYLRTRRPGVAGDRVFLRARAPWRDPGAGARLQARPAQGQPVARPRGEGTPARFDVRKLHTASHADGALPLDVIEAKVDRWIAAQRGVSARSTPP